MLEIGRRAKGGVTLRGTRAAEDGFTLVEVVVAVTIIGGAMLTILAATTSGFAFQDMARQRQTATALANEVLEQMRALPYSEVSLGVKSASVPHAVACRRNISRLYSCAPNADFKGSSEPILVNASAAAAPLNPNTASPTINGIPYTWTALISRSSTSKPLRLTVFVDWMWKGRSFSTNLQSLLWMPVGCISAPAQPVAGPCAGGDSLVGDSPVLSVAVSVSASTTPVWTALTPPGSWSFASVGLTASRGLVSEVQGRYSIFGISGSPVKQSVQADDDGTNGVPSRSIWVQETLNPGGTVATTSQVTFGPGAGTSSWSLRASYSSAATIDGNLQVAAPPDPCLIGNTTASPCGESWVEETGTSAWELSLVCNSGTCPSSPSFTVLRVAEGWSAHAILDESVADPTTSTMTLTRTVPEIRVGCITSSACGNSSPAVLYFTNLSDLAKADVNSAASPPTPSLTTGTYSYRGSNSTCVAASTATQGTARSLATTVASFDRCFSDVAIANNVWVYKFTSITYTPPSASAGRVTGPRLSFTLQLLTCNNGVCNSPVAKSPKFDVTLELPSLVLSGGSVSW